MPKPPVSRERLIDVALRMLEEDGVAALSMRKLAAELGVAVTAIYWHVGNREALLDALVERELTEMGAIRASGSTPAVRLCSLARSLRAKLLARPHLIGLVNERGLTSQMFLPAQVALARQFWAAGLRDRDAAMAVRAVQFHVIGSVVLQRSSERSPAQHPTAEELWREHAVDAGIDATVATHLADSLDPADVFELSTLCLVRSLVGGAASSG